MKMHPIMKHIESTSEQPCRILIADDEPLVCELMQFNLEKEDLRLMCSAMSMRLIRPISPTIICL